jgi:hypothetical protein
MPTLYDVYARLSANSGYSYQLTAPMPVISKLFHMSPEMERHVTGQVARLSCCEVAAGEHGAWASLADRKSLVLAIDIRECPKARGPMFVPWGL